MFLQAQRRFREYCKKVLSEVDTLLVLAAFNGTSGATFVKRADDSLQRRNEEGGINRTSSVS